MYGRQVEWLLLVVIIQINKKSLISVQCHACLFVFKERDCCVRRSFMKWLKIRALVYFI